MNKTRMLISIVSHYTGEGVSEMGGGILKWGGGVIYVKSKLHRSKIPFIMQMKAF